MGVALSDAHSAIHSGPLRRSTPNASAATISGWTLPRDAMSTMKLPMRTANAVAALLRILRAGTTTATDAPMSAIDHAESTTALGRYVSGIHSAANHGA